ncbi:MAG: hypothetical protein J5I47_12045 [Vicingus serpentipes]|nr:hypothetical protein [Vicingus serpentipes]
MKKVTLICLLLLLQLSSWGNSDQDTIVPSKHKFTSDEVWVPKVMQASQLIQLYMSFLKEGKRTMGFLHEDELAMIGEKNMTEKRLFFDSYKVISIGQRMAIIQVYAARGASLTCKKLTLRYYQDMHGNYYLVPGKVSKFEKKMGDVTLREIFIDTWTSEMICD